jgi:hypothetical protein
MLMPQEVIEGSEISLANPLSTTPPRGPVIQKQQAHPKTET